MAICKPSVIANISGKLSGCEFAITRNGTVIKHQKPPRQPSTLKALKSQWAWNHRASLWHTLNFDTIRAWEIYAANHPVTNRLGETIYLNAFASFMSNLIDTTQMYPYPDLKTPPGGRTIAPSDATVELTHGGPYTIDIPIHYISDELLTASLWIARWLPKNSSRSPRTWIRIGTFQVTGPPYTWYQRCLDNHVDLIQDERVAVKLQTHYVFSFPSLPIIFYRTVL